MQFRNVIQSNTKKTFLLLKTNPTSAMHLSNVLCTFSWITPVPLLQNATPLGLRTNENFLK